MKKTIINLSAVMVALLVGLSINNACAEKETPENKVSDNAQEASRQPEYFKVVEGFLIGPDGKVYNKIKKQEGDIPDNLKIASYTYDEYGRIAYYYTGEQFTPETYKCVFTYHPESLTVTEYRADSKDVYVYTRTTEYYPL